MRSATDAHRSTQIRSVEIRAGLWPAGSVAWLAALTALVLLRSAVFVFSPASHFDSDQAVTGLMAKHLSELRAFPVFWYGQTYMLGVEAWLAAPLLAIAGATVAALKLPLLIINVAIAWLLFLGLTRETGLDEPRAAFATLFFVLAAPITSAHFLTANGGNVEPTLYVLLLWTLRARPVSMGLVLGIGFLNREFTIYGAVALLLLDAFSKRLFTRAIALRYLVAFGTAAAVWIVVLGLRQLSSAAGPGTSMADLDTRLAGNNVRQVAERVCVDGRAIGSGVGGIVTSHWPTLFGLTPQPLTDFGIESAGRQGLPGAAWLLVPILAIPVMRAISIRMPRVGPRTADFTAYLMLVAGLSLGGYLIGRCGVVDFYTMRYELLSVLGAVGLAGWYLSVERSRPLLGLWMAACIAVLLLSLTAHLSLLAQYVSRPPVAAKQELIAALDARKIRYAYADYWTAYYVSFMTRERIIVASTEVTKIKEYDRIVESHHAEAVRISRRPCDGGEQLTPAFWACRVR
jgi:hypothetical protein